MQSPAVHRGVLEIKVSNAMHEALKKARNIASMQKTANSYIMIAGPTASGKSQLAIDLAHALNGEVINADAMQMYADLSILTARPSDKDMNDIPHHLYGIIDGSHRASVAGWLRLAAQSMAGIRARGRVPILIGGTGMYLDAAINGIAPIPDVPAEIHNDAEKLYIDIGGAAFRQNLAILDPLTAARLVDGDRQRLIRAMGVLRATGKPLSKWQATPHEGALVGNPIKLAMLPPREILYQCIDDRFDVMLRAGALDEVCRLAKRQLDPTLPMMKAIGVKALKSFLDGELTLSEAGYIGKRDSRHYAKRQMTWLRNNYNAQITINTKLSKSLMEKIFSLIC